jgi:hypothetical protein
LTKKAMWASAALATVLLTASPAVAQSSLLQYIILSFLDLDHFKCYEVEDTDPENVIVGLADQFEKVTTKVKRAKRICLPVVKGHNEFVTFIEHPEDHLVCYATQDQPQTGFDWFKVLVYNQFGSQELVVTGRSNRLCVPSLKCVVTPENSCVSAAP